MTQFLLYAFHWLRREVHLIAKSGHAVPEAVRVKVWQSHTFERPDPLAAYERCLLLGLKRLRVRGLVRRRPLHASVPNLALTSEPKLNF